MKNGKRNKVRIHLRLNPLLADSLATFARRENVTVTWVIENALRSHLSQKVDR